MSLLAKFLIVTGVGIILAFWLGHLARRVPGLRIVLGIQPDSAKRVEQRDAERVAGLEQ